MEYFFTFNTKDNENVNFIVTKSHFIYDFDYVKNLSELSNNLIKIGKNEYTVINDTLDVDCDTLKNYLNNNDAIFCHDVIKIMLYFMDPRIEQFIKNNLLKILSNEYGKETNFLVYSHFEYTLRNQMIIKNLIFNNNTGLFELYKTDFQNYRGELISESLYSKIYIGSRRNGYKHEFKVFIGTPIKLSNPMSIGGYELLETIIYNLYGRKISIFYDNEKMYVQHCPKYGIISNLNFYCYNSHIDNKISDFTKQSIKPIKIYDSDALSSSTNPYNIDDSGTYRINEFNLPFEIESDQMIKVSMEILFTGYNERPSYQLTHIFPLDNLY